MAFSLALKRIKEIQSVLRHRHGVELPDNEVGRDRLRFVLEHMATLADYSRRARNFVQLWAPWFSASDLDGFIAEVRATAVAYNADAAAKRLGVDLAERQARGLTTIGATNADKIARQKLARDRKSARERNRRAERKAAKPPDGSPHLLMRDQVIRGELARSREWLTVRDLAGAVGRLPVWVDYQHRLLTGRSLERAINRSLDKLLAADLIAQKFTRSSRGLPVRHARYRRETLGGHGNPVSGDGDNTLPTIDQAAASSAIH